MSDSEYEYEYEEVEEEVEVEVDEDGNEVDDTISSPSNKKARVMEEVEEDQVGYEDDDQVVMIVDGSQGQFLEINYEAEAKEKEAKEKLWEILTPDQLFQRQKAAIDNISDIFGIDTKYARILCRHYRWKTESLINMLSDQGQAKVFQEANLSIPEKNNEIEETGDFSCPTCMDSVPIKQTTALGCGHRFCNDCWRTNLEMQIKENKSRQLICMAFKCKIQVDEDIVAKFVDASLLSRYQQSVIDSYVEDNDLVKWCPSAPSCGNACAIHNCPAYTPIEVTCSCNWKWCFNCLRSPHLPATCEMIKIWAKKCEDDSETFNWISANTKDCPKCGKAIEKNGGCNHMSCSCGNHFCWICLGPFDHTTYRHTCGKLEVDASKDNARQSLQRYLFYYERYNGHLQSAKLEDKTRNEIKLKVDQIYRLKPNSAWIEVQWLTNAMETLFAARHTLQYSYVLAYFLFDEAVVDKIKGAQKKSAKQWKISQALYEDQLEQLSYCVESLSALLNLDVDKICFDDSVKKDIIGKSVLATNRINSMYDLINQELMDDSYFVAGKGVASNSKASITSLPPPLPAPSSSSKASSAPKEFNIGDYVLELDDEDLELQKAIQASLRY